MVFRRPYLCAAYLPDAQNLLTPGSVGACPLSRLIAGVCRIVGKGWRERKTGPFSWLKVCRCRVHERSFTIYPFGMMPYSRRSLIDAPNYLSAVSDATQGIRWPEVTPAQGSTFKTQKRHIMLWCQLIGVGPLFRLAKYRRVRMLAATGQATDRIALPAFFAVTSTPVATSRLPSLKLCQPSYPL